MIYLWMNHLDQCCEVDQWFIEKIRKKIYLFYSNECATKIFNEQKLFVTQSYCLAPEDLEYRAKIIWTI